MARPGRSDRAPAESLSAWTRSSSSRGDRDLIRGDEGNRTLVRGLANRGVTTPPRRHVELVPRLAEREHVGFPGTRPRRDAGPGVRDRSLDRPPPEQWPHLVRPCAG